MIDPREQHCQQSLNIIAAIRIAMSKLAWRNNLLAVSKRDALFWLFAKQTTPTYAESTSCLPCASCRTPLFTFKWLRIIRPPDSEISF